MIKWISSCLCGLMLLWSQAVWAQRAVPQGASESYLAADPQHEVVSITGSRASYAEIPVNRAFRIFFAISPAVSWQKRQILVPHESNAPEAVHMARETTVINTPMAYEEQEITFRRDFTIPLLCNRIAELHPSEHEGEFYHKPVMPYLPDLRRIDPAKDLNDQGLYLQSTHAKAWKEKNPKLWDQWIGQIWFDHRNNLACLPLYSEAVQGDSLAFAHVDDNMAYYLLKDRRRGAVLTGVYSLVPVAIVAPLIISGSGAVATTLVAQSLPKVAVYSGRFVAGLAIGTISHPVAEAMWESLVAPEVYSSPLSNAYRHWADQEDEAPKPYHHPERFRVQGYELTALLQALSDNNHQLRAWSPSQALQGNEYMDPKVLNSSDIQRSLIFLQEGQNIVTTALKIRKFFLESQKYTKRAVQPCELSPSKEAFRNSQFLNWPHIIYSSR